MKKYYFKLEGEFHALGPIEATNERNARESIRDFLGLDRIPRNTEIWETNGTH